MQHLSKNRKGGLFHDRGADFDGHLAVGHRVGRLRHDHWLAVLKNDTEAFVQDGRTLRDLCALAER